MLYIVLGILNELKPVWYYILAAALFILSQLAWFLLGKAICQVRLIFLSVFDVKARGSDWVCYYRA